MGALTTTGRRFDLDALRVLAVLVLLAYHSSRPFDTESWHVKSLELSRPLELLGYVFTPWRLPLLFMISGAGTYFALRTRTARVYLVDRAKRLLLPLAVGMFVVVPPQVYVERVNAWMPNRQSPIDFHGSYLAFLPRIVDGVYPHGNFSWHHLWFLVYLFVFSVLALPLFLALRTPRGAAARDAVSAALARGAWIFLPAALLVAIHVGLRGAFPPNNALVGDWWNLAHYFVLFVAGYALVPDPKIGAAVERHRHLALLLAFILTVARIGVIVALGAPRPYTGHYVLALSLRGLTEWCALVAVLGYARRHLDRP
ncbi:MAG TPA: acyltransferase, partial [Terriglobales bacterium]|nr:acyltransferase [Terriglobales bacterium]